MGCTPTWRMCSCLLSLLAASVGDTSSVKLPADTPHYLLEDDVVIRLLARPPLFDIQRAGTTTWYPCRPEALQPNSTDPPPVIDLQWLTPEHVPRFNYTGGEWHHLQGHGYFVAEDINNSLVLVHPTESDEGRYTCRLQVGGKSLEAPMELYIIRFDRRAFVWRTLHGVLGAALMAAVVGVFYVLYRLVVRPYVKRAAKVPVRIEVDYPDEAHLSLQAT